ncbi:hypothetical protein J6590_074210 [Homalodisca vitripennis]|nr:hypothetical protein J6590_074210 [Homalodisca vitripennis]
MYEPPTSRRGSSFMPGTRGGTSSSDPQSFQGYPWIDGLTTPLHYNSHGHRGGTHVWRNSICLSHTNELQSRELPRRLRLSTNG